MTWLIPFWCEPPIFSDNGFSHAVRWLVILSCAESRVPVNVQRCRTYLIRFVHHFLANGEFELALQYGNVQFGWKLTICIACDLEIWWKTFKNNRVPLLNHIELCASLHYCTWIKTANAVRKRLNWDLSSATLTSDLWPWPFVWTSL